ncbi:MULTISPECIES: calcium-binding protein [unclassified Rhizobium]|uniref:calcium-binding protein n=1 Tax=unclassified Rhizobium TaxID=2613769 RepID=UPI0006FD0069|nr:MULTISPECIES: calcium-binding protein [unclassified Rhizobium]KQV39160.1 hypothetical protein ASC86_23115 [Rhizobium sp. Root1212]KRD35134.1 hypothetical protein ASE37_21685 [Rhizobium sp. Root268]
MSWSDYTGFNYYQNRLSWYYTANAASIWLYGDDSIGASSQADTLKGYGGNDVIRGYLGDDMLSGGSGSDSLDGGGGDDLLFGGTGDDLIVGAVGDDSGSGGDGDDGLRGGDGDDFLSGGLGDDTISGDAGSDNLSGDDGDDTVSGGDGNDLVDGGAGFDRLSGGAGDDDIFGGDGNDDISGGDGIDTIYGDAGNDRLNGGAGADRMEGGKGNDTYYVDNARDVLVEASNAGSDAVFSSVSYTLSANIEKLTLTGTGNLNGTGNALANTIVGTSGKNTLDGGAGADSLSGGAGDDTYIVDNSSDVVSEASAAGTDTVKASASFTLAANVEKLVLTGSGNINGTGNTLANTIDGNGGANRISGGDGGDALNGGLGNDTLTGGAGADKFHFNTTLGATNVDHITDFVVADDTIYLGNSVFAAISAAGTLAAAAFYASTSGTAHDASDRIIYETDTGKLFYDKDGTGSAAAVLFATLDTKPAITNADFIIV